MQSLTPEGRTLVEQLAQRHGIGTDAVMVLLRALDRGGGMQAQFSHPDLGGMGQWSRGGMIMVGDMFNNGLKARVDQLCNELSDALRSHTLFTPDGHDNGAWVGTWWPKDWGAPSSSGSQNDMSYACFPDTRRLAVRTGGTVRVYDTGDHRIGGVSQQQSGSQDLTFTSQYGTVRIHELGLIGDGATQAATPAPEPTQWAPTVEAVPPAMAPTRPDEARPEPPQPRPNFTASSDEDVFGKIERLHELQRKGILSEAEFAEKKKELLARL